MKSMRYPLIAALAVFIILFVFGSVFDLEIAKGLYASEGAARGFGLFMAAFSMYFGYAIYAIFGGAFLHLAVKFEWKKWVKAILIVLAVAAYGAAVFFSGREPWSVNGYNDASLNWLGYLIGAVVNFGFGVAGWFVSKKINNKELLKVILIVLPFVVFAMTVGITGLKALMHRPRFRYLINENLIKFVPWWKASPYYKDVLENLSPTHPYITSEEFKSFPSGHAGVSCTLMMLATLLPLLGKKAAKWQLPAFIGGFIWALLVSLSRMIVGAHYLSDVSMGAIISLICFFAANEIIIREKKLQPALEEMTSK